MTTEKSGKDEERVQSRPWVLTEGKMNKGGIREVFLSPRPKVPPQGKTTTNVERLLELVTESSRK